MVLHQWICKKCSEEVGIRIFKFQYGFTSIIEIIFFEFEDIRFKFQYGFTSIFLLLFLSFPVQDLNSNMVLHQYICDYFNVDMDYLNLNSNMVLHQFGTFRKTPNGNEFI